MNLKFIEEKQADHTFCIYNANSAKNIVFLGSCHFVPIIFYYSMIKPDFNIYHIYPIFWGHEPKDFPISIVNDILKNTNTIITETMHNYGILNTDYPKDKKGFFNTFDTSHLNEIRVPNLMLSMYLYDIINAKAIDENLIDEYYDNTFKTSLERLKSACESYNFMQLYNFIVNYFTEIRMFYTFLHPSKTLSMLTFKILMNKLNEAEKIPPDFFLSMKQYDFLEDWCSPIVKKDVEYHNLKFPSKIFEDSVCTNVANNISNHGKYSQPDRTELEVTNKSIEIINST